MELLVPLLRDPTLLELIKQDQGSKSILDRVVQLLSVRYGVQDTLVRQIRRGVRFRDVVELEEQYRDGRGRERSFFEALWERLQPERRDIQDPWDYSRPGALPWSLRAWCTQAF